MSYLIVNVIMDYLKETLSNLFTITANIQVFHETDPLKL